MKRSRGRRPALLLASALVALGGAGLALGTRPGPAGDTIARATPTPADRSPTPSPAESQLQAAATSPPAPEQPEPRALAELLELAEPGPERLQAYLTLRRLRPVDPALGRAAGTVLAVRQVAPAVPGVSGDKQLPLGFADQTLLYLDGTRPHAWDLANPTRDPRPLRDRPALRPYHLAVSRRGAGWTFYLAGFRPRTQGSVYWADAETGGRAQDSPAQLEGLPQEVAREWAGKFTDALAPSPDGSRLALAHGHDVVVYAVPAFAEARRFGPHAAPVRRLAWSRDGRVLAWSTGEPDTIGPQNALHAWWPADDRRLPGRLLPDEAQPALIEGLAFDPGGQLLASFKQVLIRDALGTPRPLIGDDFAANVIRAADDAFSRLVCFGSRGLMAATHTRLDTEGQIQGWDLERGVQVSSLSLTQLGYEGGVRALSVNEELGLVVVGLAQGTLALIALPDLDGPALAGRTGR